MSGNDTLNQEKKIRADLIAFIRGSKLNATPGAAEYLADRAVAAIFDAGPRRSATKRAEEAKDSFSQVIEALDEARPDHATGPIRQPEIKRLRQTEAFCGVRPWC